MTLQYTSNTTQNHLPIQLNYASQKLCKLSQNPLSVWGKISFVVALRVFQNEHWLEIPSYKWKGNNLKLTIQAPDKWTSLIKQLILRANPSSQICFFDEKMLDQNLLNSLLLLGCNHIKNFILKYSREVIPLLKSNDEINCLLFIKKIIEKNLLVDGSQVVQDLLYLSSFKYKKLPPSLEEKLTFQVHYLKGLCHYHSGQIFKSLESKIGFHPQNIHRSDFLFLYLLQIFQLSPSNNEKKNEILKSILKDCQNKRADESFTNSDDTKEFFETINHLSALFKTNLMTNFRNSIVYFKLEDRPLELMIEIRCLYKQSKNLIFGMYFPIDNTAIQKSAFELLNSLPLLTSHENAIQQIETLFQSDQERNIKKMAATALYKWWWYGEYRWRKAISLVDKEIQWLMLDLFLNNTSELSRTEAVKQVENEFRENLPLLPFNQVCAENFFSTLQLAQKTDFFRN